jgi:hypothetical protein
MADAIEDGLVRDEPPAEVIEEENREIGQAARRIQQQGPPPPPPAEEFGMEPEPSGSIADAVERANERVSQLHTARAPEAWIGADFKIPRLGIHVTPERAGREGDTQDLPIGNDLPVAHVEVAKDLQARLELGVKRYGQPLQPYNGRKPLRDAYEEVLDLAVYLWCAMYEQENPKPEGPPPMAILGAIVNDIVVATYQSAALEGFNPAPAEVLSDVVHALQGDGYTVDGAVSIDKRGDVVHINLGLVGMPVSPEAPKDYVFHVELP